ncbi:MAG: hypothetical protein MK212_21605 [Saprospiraceae bacterium]|nr:hypothetical protein [Saprospiraceae bacterium]
MRSTKTILIIAAIMGGLILFLWKTRIIDFKASSENGSTESANSSSQAEKVASDSTANEDFINDSLYRWDDKKVDWVSIGTAQIEVSAVEILEDEFADDMPIRVSWETLLDINYRLRYFKKKQAEMFAPVFGPKLKVLDGKKVIIKGYVIPIDEEGELVALSANPYSSCYFCGNASPASVISMFMKNPDDLFAMDAYKEFYGKLILNYDDPDQFYYILENAKEID